MSTISDIIEDFILSTMGKDDTINISRNELADFFKCAPSQINYVLTTRFNLNRGYITKSQRGGGGYIKLVKIKNSDDNYVLKIVESIPQSISARDVEYILEDLMQKNYLTIDKAKIISYALSDKALNNPINIEGILRANILKNVLVNILKEEKNE